MLHSAPASLRQNLCAAGHNNLPDHGYHNPKGPSYLPTCWLVFSGVFSSSPCIFVCFMKQLQILKHYENCEAQRKLPHWVLVWGVPIPFVWNSTHLANIVSLSASPTAHPQKMPCRGPAKNGTFSARDSIPKHTCHADMCTDVNRTLLFFSHNQWRNWD